MNKHRVGIIGCGAIMSVHLDAIDAIEYAELKVVCDVDQVKAIQVSEENHCDWTSDYKKVLERDDVDLVHILTPHYLHVPMAIDALKAGKHVVLEKPVGISQEQLMDIKKAEAISDKTVGVILQNRFNPSTIKMKELLDANDLGRLIASKGLVVWSRKDDYYRESNWRGKLAFEGGGLLINQSIHTLDLMSYIGGEVVALKANVVNNSHPDIEVEDTAMVTYYYKNGGVGNFYGTNSYGANDHVEMAFIFEKGTLRFLDQKLYLIQDGHVEFLVSDEEKEGNKAYWGMSHRKCIENIYSAIKDGHPPMITLNDAIKATELVINAYISSGQQDTYHF